MIKTASDFGALVREKRKALNWTQGELARRCGTGDRFIVDLEAGKESCQLGKALAAAREVGMDLMDGRKMHAAPPSVTQNDDDDLSFLPRY